MYGMPNNEVASREHIARCATSRLETTEALCDNGTNPLDNILNEDATIREGRGIKTTEEIIEYITRKCLRRSSGCRPSIAIMTRVWP